MAPIKKQRAKKEVLVVKYERRETTRGTKFQRNILKTPSTPVHTKHISGVGTPRGNQQPRYFQTSGGSAPGGQDLFPEGSAGGEHPIPPMWSRKKARKDNFMHLLNTEIVGIESE
jgi:hypothetical protein